MSQFQENLQIDRRTDGRSDGQTLFYRTKAKAGGIKNISFIIVTNADGYITFNVSIYILKKYRFQNEMLFSWGATLYSLA